MLEAHTKLDTSVGLQWGAAPRPRGGALMLWLDDHQIAAHPQCMFVCGCNSSSSKLCPLC
jgi:hypothetical protein